MNEAQLDAIRAWCVEEYGPSATRTQIISEVAQLHVLIERKNQEIKQLRETLTQSERDFLEEFFEDSIENKRAHGGNATWLLELGGKVLGLDWFNEVRSKTYPEASPPESPSSAPST